MVKLIPYCTISGSSVWELPYGLDERHPDCIALKVAITEKIASLCQMGVSDFLCNANLGVPLWAAEAIVGMWKLLDDPVRIHLFIPYEAQASFWRMTSGSVTSTYTRSLTTSRYLIAASTRTAIRKLTST